MIGGIQCLLLCSCYLMVKAHGNAPWTKNPECGSTKGCFSGCQGGCYEASWKEVGDSIAFTLKAEATTEAYLAIAFSNDQQMASDSVTACIYSGGNTQVYNSYNVDGTTSNQPISNNKLGLSAESGSFANGVMTCSFSRKKVNADPKIFDLNNDYYIMMAKGPASGTALGIHDLTNLPLISDEKADFQSTMDIHVTGSAKNVLVKIHGSLMVLAWVFSASIGIVLARFYKPVWSDKTLLGEKYWFQFHRSLMVLALLAVIGGIVVIFVDVGEWSHLIGQSDWKRAHPYIGIVVGAVILINPLMALFRPHPDGKYRYIFNWAHWAVGTLGHLLAVLNIFIGVELPATNAPSWLIIVLAVYVGYQILFEISLEIYDNCCGGGAKTIKFKSTYIQITKGDNFIEKSEIYELHEKSEQGQKNIVETGDAKKKILLALHVLVILGFSATLIIVISLS